MSGTPYTIGRIGLVIRGAYSDAASYNALDVVQYDDSSYVCSAACTGISPVDHQHWMLLAEGATHIEHLSADVIDAGTITADKCVAGMITATNGLISTGAIGTAQIADGSITDAKIVELTANKIAAGTIDASLVNVINLRADNLTVGTINGQRIPVLGTEKIADGAISGVKVAQNAITADKIVAEAVTAAKIAANAITANKVAAQAITADKVDIANLFSAAATINALKAMTVKSIEDGSALILNKDQIRMETPSTVIAIPGGEEGQVVFRADAGGVYADKIESPTVVRRVPGGIYLVGSGMDFGSLDEAFDLLENNMLSGDITLKLLQDDPGGTLRGVTGGGAINITSGDVLDQSAAFVRYASLTVENTNNYKITATAADTWTYVVVQIARVGDLSLAGKQITVSVGEMPSNGSTAQQISLFAFDSNYQTGFQIGNSMNSTNVNTSQTFTIPNDISDDYNLTLALYASSGTLCALGAYTTYCNLRVELGATLAPIRAANKTVLALNIANNSARINVGRIVAPNGIVVRGSGVTLSESEMYGPIGVLTDMAQVRMHNNKGSCTKAVNAICSQVVVTGTAPSGTYSGKTVDTSDATISGSGSAPTATTKTLTANSTGTYSSYWWTGDQSIRQGYTPSNNRIRGGMWFDMGQIPSGATVSGMRLTLSRISGYGKGADVDVKAYATVSDARNGAPALTAGSYALGTIGEGKTKTFDLPAALVTGLKAGTYKGIVLYADDTTVLSGKTYSSNYARFGGTDGTAPKLAVTYTA